MSFKELLLRRRRLSGFLLGFLIGLLVFLLNTAAIFTGWELSAYDLRFRLRNVLGMGPEPDDRIILVGLDEESYEDPDRKPGPWSRKDFARMVSTLTEYGAELICLDIIFSKEKDEEEDDLLARSVYEANNVVLASDISEENRSVPLPIFRSGEVGEGFINLLPDREDGVIRRIPVQRVEKTGGTAGSVTHVLLPFAQQAAYAYLYPYDPPPITYPSENSLRFGDTEIPQTREGMLINFVGDPGTFPKIPVRQILKGEADPSMFNGKIVLVGSMQALEHDTFPTPFHGKVSKEETVFKEKKRYSPRDMYGIEIHANALHTILTRSFIRPVGIFRTGLIFMVVCLISTLSLIVRKSGAWFQIALSLLILSVYCVVSYLLFVRAGLWLETVPALVLILSTFVGGILYHRALEVWNKRQIVSLFGKYVSKGVVDLLVQHPESVCLGGKKARLTVFFSDIRGFTSMTEHADPSLVSEILNEYFNRMTIVLFKHGGTLDKFMGDGLMAFFGDPVGFSDHAARAVRTALDMLKEMESLKEKWRREGKKCFDIGIGINTGDMIVGNHGSGDFFDYTVIGDEVNLASRLEKRAPGGQVLISGSTHQEIERDFETIDLGPVSVKGKEVPVHVYRVLGEKSKEE